MKDVHVVCLWSTEHDIRVPDDFDPAEASCGAIADQVDSHGAALVDFNIVP